MTASGHSETNPNGAFRVNLAAPEDDVATGHVSRFLQVTASKSGFVSRSEQGVPMGATGLRIVLSRPAFLAGYVVDAVTGAPVTHFYLTVERPDTHPDSELMLNRNREEYRSEDGGYVLEAPYGLERLAVSAPGYVGALFYPNLSAGTTNDDFTIALNPAPTVRVAVYDADTRAPIAGANVQFNPVGPLTRSVLQYTTDAQGQFVLEEVPDDGSLDFVIYADGYATQHFSALPLVADGIANVYLNGGGTVEGRVSYQGKPPLANGDDYGFVKFSPAGGANYFGEQCAIQAGGNYRAEHLSDGLHLAQAWIVAPDNWGRQSAHYVVDVRAGVVSQLNIDFPEKGGDLRVGVAGVADPESVRLELCTTDEDAIVLMSPESNPWHYNEPGRFPSFAPGRYILRGSLPEPGGAVIEQLIEIQEGRTTELVLEFDESGSESDE